MTISDLLTILGIILAILAFISEKNRQFVLLKFSKWNWYFIFAVFIICNYLIGYSWFKENITFLEFVEIKGFPTSAAYAYLISISTLIWASFKIYKGKFPKANSDKLLNYYIQLLLKSEYSTLINLIEKYHFSYIIKYIEATKSNIVQNSFEFLQTVEVKYNKEYEKVINTNNLKIASKILERIIYDEGFIEEVTKKNPYFFLPIIKLLNNNKVQNQDFVNLFLKTLIKEKNSNFFREIKEIETLITNDTENDFIILYSLIHDIKVVETNNALYGVCEQAIIELLEEANKDYSFLREPDMDLSSNTLWDFRIQIAIKYVDIIEKQIITTGVNFQINLVYYLHFIKAIEKNILPSDIYDESSEIPSRNHKLLQEIMQNQIKWIELIIKKKNKDFLNSVCNCIGLCTFEIATSEKLSDRTKQYLIDSILTKFIKLSYKGEDKESVNQAILLISNYLRTPIMGINCNPKKPEYDRIMDLVLDNIDLPKFQSNEEIERINRLKSIICELD